MISEGIAQLYINYMLLLNCQSSSAELLCTSYLGLASVTGFHLVGGVFFVNIMLANSSRNWKVSNASIRKKERNSLCLAVWEHYISIKVKKIKDNNWINNN